MYAFLIMGDAERLLQTEFTDAVFFIELGQCSLHLFSRSVCANFSASSQIRAQIRLL